MQTGLTSFLDKVIARGAMRASGEKSANGVGERIGDGGVGERIGRKTGDAEGQGTGSTFAAEFARMIRVLRAEVEHPRHAAEVVMEDATTIDGEADPDGSEDVEGQDLTDRGMPITAGSFAWRWHHETGDRTQDAVATQALPPETADTPPEEPGEASEAAQVALADATEDVSWEQTDDPVVREAKRDVSDVADMPAPPASKDARATLEGEAEPDGSAVEEAPVETADNHETEVRAQVVPVPDTNPVQDAMDAAESPAANVSVTSSPVTDKPAAKKVGVDKASVEVVDTSKEQAAVVAASSSGRVAKPVSGAADTPVVEGEAPDGPAMQNAASQQSALGKDGGDERHPDARPGNRPAGDTPPRGMVGQVKVDVVSAQTHMPPAPPATVQLLGDTIGEALKELANTRFAGEAGTEIFNQGEPAQPGASRRMVVDLNPRDLGTVRVTLVNRAGELHIEIVSSTDKATDLLNSHRDALAQSIRQAGSAVTEISVRAAQDGGAGREFQAGQQQTSFNWSGSSSGNGAGGEKSGGAQHPFSDVPQGGQPRPDGDGKSEAQADIRSGIYL